MVTYKTLVNQYLIMLCCIIMMLPACKKSTGFKPADFEEVKVYDDTLANAQSSISWISAGKEQIYMTYGSSSFGVHVNFNFDPQNVKSRLMATDINGNFLWRRDFPVAIDQAVVVALEEGGCLAAGKYNWGGINPSLTQNNVYIFRYDRYGNLLKTDSVDIVNALALSYNQGTFLNAYQGSDGKIIFHGDCGGMGYCFQYSVENGMTWIKSLNPDFGASFYFTQANGCIQTPDKGYLIAGSFTDYSNPETHTYPLLIKLNASGDTVWARKYGSYGRAWIWDRNLIALRNGNYCFAFNEVIDNTCNAHLLEFNENGDSIHAAVVKNGSPNVIGMIAPLENGGCLALLNQSITNAINPNSGRVFQQMNTRMQFFDADLKRVSEKYFQKLTTDYLVVACKTTNNKIACFGMIQDMNKKKYLPHLYFINN